MVIKTFPLPLATAHNAIAALLVLAMVALLRFLSPKGSGLYRRTRRILLFQA